MPLALGAQKVFPDRRAPRTAHVEPAQGSAFFGVSENAFWAPKADYSAQILNHLLPADWLIKENTSFSG